LLRRAAEPVRATGAEDDGRAVAKRHPIGMTHVEPAPGSGFG